MVRAEGFFPNLQRTLVQRLGLGILALASGRAPPALFPLIALFFYDLL